jgi:ubiquinone biosynthesis protein UbiJ
MIRFEQDPRGAIEEIICEEVRADIHGDLYNVDRAVDAIMTYIDQLKHEIELLKARLERIEDNSIDILPY